MFAWWERTEKRAHNEQCREEQVVLIQSMSQPRKVRDGQHIPHRCGLLMEDFTALMIPFKHTDGDAVEVKRGARCSLAL